MHAKKLISIICNLDSRPGVGAATTEFHGHNDGARSWDFFTAGLENKLKFFAGFDVELIVFIDEHEPVPNAILDKVREMANCVTLRKHTRRYRNYDTASFTNDINYIHALSQARGDIIAHFDGDTAAFARDEESVNGLLALLETHRFVSYPSQWSPDAVEDATFQGRKWASTRFFLCRRDHLQFDVLERALREPEWAYEIYGQPARKCPWLEHFLSLCNEESVIYPPRADERLLIFCWDKYYSGVLPELNRRDFGSVRHYINGCGGVHYPNDVTGKPL